MTTYSAPTTVDDLIQAVSACRYGVDPATLPVIGVFWVAQSTRFPGTTQTYRNYYLLFRVGAHFGACCVERDQFDAGIADTLAGSTVAELLADARLPVRIAALDAYLAGQVPHDTDMRAERVMLPFGDPPTRAIARDEAIVRLLRIEPGTKVGLIGVVNPLVAAIKAQGGVCLPCDFNMERTQDGQAVVADMTTVLEEADMLLVTGMTLGNGSFDAIIAVARRRGIPLVAYAQTGSAILPRFLGHGLTGLSAEPFPFSQFSGDPTPIHLYRHDHAD